MQALLVLLALTCPVLVLCGRSDGVSGEGYTDPLDPELVKHGQDQGDANAQVNLDVLSHFQDGRLDEKIRKRQDGDEEQGDEKEGEEIIEGTGGEDCLEALFKQAQLTEEEIPNYIQAFRRNTLDADAIFRLDFKDLIELLKRPQMGFKSVGDIFKLHTCTTTQQPCQSQPFCMNGGRCMHVNRFRQHVCQCADTFTGDRCSEKIEDRVGDLESDVSDLEQQLFGSSAVYTRWGRTECNADAGASLVYAGFMAGPHYTHKGGGAGYLCMPQEPIYDQFRSGVQNRGLIYVSEFMTSGAFSPFSGLHYHNPRCAICQGGDGRGTTLTVPARNVCPSGWTQEYKGYLMTEYHGHRRTQHICVDENPEVVSGTHARNGGALLYFIEAVCQSEMPCGSRGKYDQNKELTCAVCSR